MSLGLSLLIKGLLAKEGAQPMWVRLIRKPRLNDATATAMEPGVVYNGMSIVEHGIKITRREEGFQIETWGDDMSGVGSKATAQTHINVVVNKDATEVMFGSFNAEITASAIFTASASTEQRVKSAHRVSVELLADLNTITGEFVWDA